MSTAFIDTEPELGRLGAGSGPSYSTEASQPDLDEAWFSVWFWEGSGLETGEEEERQSLGFPAFSKASFREELAFSYRLIPVSDTEALWVQSEILVRIWDSLPAQGFLNLTDWRIPGERGWQRKVGAEEPWAPSDPRTSFFISSIRSEIEAEPVESGMAHPAEETLGKWLEEDPGGLKDWMDSLLNTENNGAFVASVLRCFGRVAEGKMKEEGAEILRLASENPDVEVRDAAYQVLDSWGGHEALRILKVRAGLETDVWLREYIEKVVEDLTEE